MAVRFDLATERLARTTGVLSFDSNYTIMAWVYVVTHNGAGNGACVVSIDDQTDDVDEFYLNASTATNLTLGIVTLQGGSAAGDVGTATFTAGTWQHVAIVRSANNSRIGYRNGTAEVTHTLNRSGRTAPTALSIGSVLDSDLLNGRIAYIKIWTSALSQAEVQAEMATPQPIVTSNVWGWWPLTDKDDLTDKSGNGRTLTAVGTLSTEAGPPMTFKPSVTDSVTVSESVTASVVGGGVVTPSVNVTDSTTVAETVAVTLTRRASVSDSATVAESVTVSVGAAATRTVSVSDSAAVAESVTISRGAMTVSVSDAATVGEAVTVVRQAQAVLSVSVSDSATVADSGIGYPLGGACIAGVLRQNSANGRYLENDSGPLVLAGFHTWYDLQDGGTTSPPPAFAWSTYMAALKAKGVNFTKLWRLESTRDWPSDNTQRFGIQPWRRTGPGNAADGGLKFDLTSFNQEYFDRLRARCVELGNAGIYVAIQLFQGFHVDNTKEGAPSGDPWAYNPFNSTNNVNSVNGDIDGDGIGDDSRSTTNTACYNVQKAFVERVVDTVNDLDNVIYEISNEDGTWSETWQKALVDYIHTYESGKAKQHPTGMTKLYPGSSNSVLTSSNADWISPDEDLTPAAQNSTSQSWMYDTDHSVGITSTRAWAWIALCQGYAGAWYMDLWDSLAGGNPDTTADATYEQIRRTLGWVLDYAAQIDLASATPQGALSSAGYALAKTTGSRHQYLAYQSGSGNFTLDLSSTSGVLTVEWQRVANSAGTIQSGGTVNGGAVRTLTPPWAGEDVMAYLWQSTYTVSVTDSASVSESVTVSITAVGTRSVSVSDAITVAESIGRLLLSSAAITDAATVAESVAAALGLPGVNVADSATVAESVTVTLAPAGVNVTDTATVTETAAAQIAAALTVTITDAAAVSEAINVIATVAGQMYVNVADAIEATDTPAVGVLVLPGVSVADSAATGESVTAALALAGVSVADTVTVAESVTVAVTAQGTLLVSVSDGAAVDDTAATAPLGLADVSVSDGATLTEQVTAQTLEAGAIQISVGDTVGIVETCGAVTALPGVSVVESITVAELIVAYMMGAAHADWTTSTAAVWGWTLGSSAVYQWTLSNRSRS